MPPRTKPRLFWPRRTQRRGRDEVLAVIAEGLDDGGDWDALGALNAMLLLGVLDNEPETRTIRAGIPSFMEHIAKVSAPIPHRLHAL